MEYDLQRPSYCSSCGRPMSGSAASRPVQPAYRPPSRRPIYEEEYEEISEIKPGDINVSFGGGGATIVPIEEILGKGEIGYSKRRGLSPEEYSRIVEQATTSSAGKNVDISG